MNRMVIDEAEDLTDEERRYLAESGESVEPIERLDEGPAEAPEPEAAAEEDAPADDADADTDDEPEDEGNGQDRRVPLSTLLAERKRAKEERTRREEAEQRYQQMLDRLSRLGETKPEPKQEETPPPPPDLTNDPFGHIEHLGRTVETLQQKLAREAEERAIMQERQRFESALVSREEKARQQWQDYDERVAHVGKQILNQYLFRGYDENAAMHYASQEMKATAYNLAQAGIDPAEWFYRSAEERFGYRAELVAPAAPSVDRERAKRAFKSPSHAGGSAPKGKRSAAEIANMSDDEFMEWASSTGMTADQIAALTA